MTSSSPTFAASQSPCFRTIMSLIPIRRMRACARTTDRSRAAASSAHVRASIRATCSGVSSSRQAPGFAAAEKVPPGVRPRRLAKALFLFLLLQLREIRERHGAPDLLVARRAAGKGQRAAQCAGRVRLHVFVADQMDRNIRSDRASSRYARSSREAAAGAGYAAVVGCTQKPAFLSFMNAMASSMLLRL